MVQKSDTYFVSRGTDTFADELLAYGLAALLQAILRDQYGDSGTVSIYDDGSVLRVKLERSVSWDPQDLAKVSWFCDLPYLATRTRKPPADWPGEVVDYDAERARRSQFFEARRQLSPEAQRPGATVDQYPELAALQGLQPRPDWEVLALINQMSAVAAYNSVLQAWAATRICFAELLTIILQLFADPLNDAEAARQAWKTLCKCHKIKAVDTIAPVQILNPSMGKGVNRLKADGAPLANPKVFWLPEFLKFWGLRRAALPRIIPSRQPRGPRDRKIYVLRPKALTLDTLTQVYGPFDRALRPSTAIKMDVLAALRFTDVFLEQWAAGALADVAWGNAPDDYVQGLATAFYKDLGNAAAVLNIGEIGLPGWMRVATPTDVTDYHTLLEEHRRVVESLNEDRGDERTLLQRYRDFLSGRDLEAFFAFAAGYASLTMSRMERGKWAPRLTTQTLEVLIMAHDTKLCPILKNPGFRNIAAAIRRSTVIPQYHKARGNRGPYSVRYGLGNELLRHASYPDQFIQALSAFVHEYNRETAQINERYHGNPPVRRPAVTVEDIEQVVALIDAYGAPTIANMLVAFGYAREPSSAESADDQSEVQESEEMLEVDET